MDLLEIMQTYFRGEKLEAALFIAPAGLALAALGIAALRAETGAFAWTVAIPCLLFAVVLVVVGLVVATRTNGQVAALQSAHASDAAGMLRDELPRMQVVMRTFGWTLVAFGVMATAGLLLRFAIPGEWARGLGSVLVLLGGMGLMIDGFAERRGRPYIAALQAAAEQHGIRTAEESTRR
jgi:hypothetical protein